MHVESLAKIRADIINDRDLPTVPLVVTRILALTESESSSPRELIDLIEFDHVLTARILRIANSPFFGLSRQATSLQRALMVLGYDSVRDLALGVKVWDAFVDRGGPAVLQLWQHAASVAISARSIGRELGVDTGAAFTCGLLHDIGRAALHLYAPEAMAQIAAAPGEESLAAEREVLGVDHAAVGAWMAESWNLPAILVEAIRDHHEPRPDALPPASLATIVALADELACRIERCAAPATEPALSTGDCDVLAETAGIAAGAWPDLADAVRHESADLAALFGRSS
jgi:putative nucleotidyltransferase with HDIG domain